MAPVLSSPASRPRDAREAIVSATTALAVTAACVAMFLPPLVDTTTASVLRIIAFGVGIAGGLIALTAYVGIAARRLGRSAFGWAALALLLFPVGSVIALVMLSSYRDQAAKAGAA